MQGKESGTQEAQLTVVSLPLDGCVLLLFFLPALVLELEGSRRETHAGSLLAMFLRAQHLQVDWPGRRTSPYIRPQDNGWPRPRALLRQQAPPPATPCARPAEEGEGRRRPERPSGRDRSTGKGHVTRRPRESVRLEEGGICPAPEEPAQQMGDPPCRPHVQFGWVTR